MTFAEIAHILVVWTPFLADGFLWNILISLVAMAVGTVLGAEVAVGLEQAEEAGDVVGAEARREPQRLHRGVVGAEREGIVAVEFVEDRGERFVVEYGRVLRD